jgi:hypothetical protein
MLMPRNRYSVLIKVLIVLGSCDTILNLVLFYSGCKDTFSNSRDLLNHNLMKHRNDPLKDSASPVIYNGTIPTQKLPESLPSYAVVPVLQTPISIDRHAKLGPWVSIYCNLIPRIVCSYTRIRFFVKSMGQSIQRHLHTMRLSHFGFHVG